MDYSTLLSSLKIDLGITTDAYDARLTEYLARAGGEIAKEGITLEDNIEDKNLVIAYAAWLWRKRDTGEGLPRMIRWQLNNRLFAE